MGNTEEDENGSETSTEDDGETSLESSKVGQRPGVGVNDRRGSLERIVLFEFGLGFRREEEWIGRLVEWG